MSQSYPDPTRRLLITISTMVASMMVAIDITIANIALPQMQASMSASQDQVIWVLTSYLVATAIATPLSGWLASRYGRKKLMLFSVAGFTFSSLLCGLATSLEMMVVARLAQGACGAGLIPLSQATLLDINPPERHAKAMAVFSLGAMFGPLIGPTLGGWLTDLVSWRWIFFINLPVGVLSFLAMSVFMDEQREPRPPRFDMFGFATLAIALASFQLMLDRGEQLDWFDSTEIWIYAAVLAVSLWLTLVHMFTARNPFVRPELFADRNFAIGNVIGVAIGLVAFATMPLIVVMMQNLLNYSALHTGLVGLPRGIGTILSILLVTRLMERIDARVLLSVGLVILSSSMVLHARMDLFVDERALLVAGFVQGFGGGLLLVPLTVIVFSTLPATLRNEGAAMYALMRSIGQSIGISLLHNQLVQHTAESRSHLVEGIRPDNPMLDYARPEFDFGSSDSVATMSVEIARQASMVGNVQVFWLVSFAGLAMVPLVLFMKSSKNRQRAEALPAVE